jgi:hypothetical protein
MLLVSGAVHVYTSYCRAMFYSVLCLNTTIILTAWLHKAIFATAEESMDLDFGEHLLYVDFLITRTRNFRLCGVEPVLVFDGKRSILKVRNL